MTLMPASPGPRRGAVVDRAVIEATLQVISEAGFASLTMRAVARAAGVSSATLYARWPSKSHLIAGVLQEIAPHGPIPDAGDLEHDLAALLQSMSGLMTFDQTGPAWSRLLSDMRESTELADIFDREVRLPYQRAVDTVLRRARRRGELRSGLGERVVRDLLTGPLEHHLIRYSGPPRPSEVKQLAAALARALRRDP